MLRLSLAILFSRPVQRAYLQIQRKKMKRIIGLLMKVNHQPAGLSPSDTEPCQVVTPLDVHGDFKSKKAGKEAKTARITSASPESRSRLVFASATWYARRSSFLTNPDVSKVATTPCIQGSMNASAMISRGRPARKRP